MTKTFSDSVLIFLHSRIFYSKQQ